MLDNTNGVSGFRTLIQKTKTKYRYIKYLISDLPYLCKDIFSLKSNQLTMRNCAIKNFALWYMTTNAEYAEDIANEAADNNELEKCKQYGIVADALKMFITHLEKEKQILVDRKWRKCRGDER
jgi:hypothetical protein